MADEPTVVAEIKLTVTDRGIYADTELPFAELMLWLQAAQHQFLAQMFMESENPVKAENPPTE